MGKHRASGSPAATRSAAPGQALVATGAALFVVGLAFVVAVFVPFLLGDKERGLALSLATFLTVVGLALALLGLLRQARASRGPGDTP